MNDRDKVIEYELQIEDLLNAIKVRISEFPQDGTLDEFEDGRKCAYYAIMDMIASRYQMIHEVIAE